ncbi:TIGR02647 family protein [Halomonas sp. ND22Bw]|uniref:DNA-binding protein n=1 Tax=Halomonas salina TaxID=42565 RepID=A0ABR4WVH1_9GAMM|nr:TIGR02647 family protein [Halomonas salina]KGE78726.1 DNA-binding protein [Halomonas salina]PSJ21826.1 TIGR02647 family protein [Halomonas sp. ND22Bw]
MPQPSYTPELLDELKMLGLFNPNNHQEGIKVHSSAEPAMIEAAQRLHRKGLVTQDDGGYLTATGQEAAEHARDLLTLLGTADATT